MFSPACLDELQVKLNASQEKAFFIVHPFYLESIWYKGHLTDAVQGKVEDTQLTDFFQRLKSTLPKLIRKGVPVIILQEMAYLGDNRLEDEANIKTQYEGLCEHLSQISDGVDPKSIFVMYTERGGPLPLKGKGEEKTEWLEVIKDRMEALKKAGLATGIVSGREFKPSEGDRNEYYASADDKDYGWGKTADKAHRGFLLKDYYDKSREGKPGLHPLQVIRSDQCVGELLRMLAMNGIRPATSNLTYPEQIHVASDYIEQQYGGKKVYSLKQK